MNKDFQMSIEDAWVKVTDKKVDPSMTQDEMLKEIVKIAQKRSSKVASLSVDLASLRMKVAATWKTVLRRNFLPPTDGSLYQLDDIVECAENRWKRIQTLKE